MQARAFEILAAIDLRGGRVVRLMEGDFDRETIFSDDPAEVADGFARAGARWLHVVDLDGARTGVPAHTPAIAAIVEAVGERVRVEVAGGLRDEEAVTQALLAGAARAVIGTAAIEDPGLAGRVVEANGAARIAVAIDVRGGLAVGHGWIAGADPTNATDDTNAAELILRLADVGVETFEVTAIERDGLLGGPDLALYERLVALDVGSIIASGGVTTLADVAAVRNIGCRGAIIGRALYEGRLTVHDALSVAGR